MIDGATSHGFLALTALVVFFLAFMVFASWLGWCAMTGVSRPGWLLIALGGSLLAVLISWWATLTR